MKNIDFDIEERAKQAIDNFNAGYNCAQSVFLTYSDLFDLDWETAKSMSVSFGGGMGRMREICGTISAMCMLAGFRYPVVDPQDQKARTRNYAMVQKMAALFKEKYGTIDRMPGFTSGCSGLQERPSPFPTYSRILRQTPMRKVCGRSRTYRRKNAERGTGGGLRKRQNVTSIPPITVAFGIGKPSLI